MKKSILTTLFVVVLLSIQFASNGVDPLPTIDPGPVHSQYNWREYEIILHDVGSDPESTVHCIFPGSNCRFTTNPDE